MRMIRLAVAVLLTVAAACSSEGGTAPDAEPGGLMVSTWQEIRLGTNKGKNLPVQITRLGGYDGPVTLSVADLPTGVSATFTPRVQASTARVGQAVMWLRAIEGADTGETSIVLTATGPGINPATWRAKLRVSRYCGMYYGYYMCFSPGQ